MLQVRLEIGQVLMLALHEVREGEQAAELGILFEQRHLMPAECCAASMPAGPPPMTMTFLDAEASGSS